MYKRLYISPGNSKLGFIPSFSIPEDVNCPGATPQCRKDCYFKYMRLRLKRLDKTVKDNDQVVKTDPDWVNRMIHSIQNMNCRYFRIHTGGDFFDQNYLNGWIETCKSLPDITFLAFTKSFKLDYSAAPDNLNIMWSIFPDTIMEDIPPGPKAFTLIPDMTYPASMLLNIKQCAGNCLHCGICFHSNQNQIDVAFKAHGGKYNNKNDKQRASSHYQTHQYQTTATHQEGC
jgi:hypothetical protein